MGNSSECTLSEHNTDTLLEIPTHLSISQI